MGPYDLIAKSNDLLEVEGIFTTVHLDGQKGTSLPLPTPVRFDLNVLAVSPRSSKFADQATTSELFPLFPVHSVDWRKIGKSNLNVPGSAPATVYPV